jgi:predicted O-methyltransferase YrrM
MVMFDEKAMENIKGFLDREEGEHLYQTASKACRLGPCLEIGSYCGKSAVYLGTACRETGQVLYSVDHHRGSEEQQPGEEYFDPALFDYDTFQIDTFAVFRKTIEKAGIQNSVIPIVCSSETFAKSWRSPLGLVFIDGGHSYEAASTDYKCWAEHIIQGGFLLIHDIFKNPEEGGQAPFMVYKLALKSGLFRELPMLKTLGVLQRL